MSSMFDKPDPDESRRQGESGAPGQSSEGQGQGQPQGYGYGQPQGYGYGQPQGYGYGQPQGEPPPNHLVWAILSTVLCCLPLGIASIVFSSQVNSKWAQGDVAGAHASSRKAKQFAIWAAIVSLVLVVLYILFFVVIAANGGFETDIDTEY